MSEITSNSAITDSVNNLPVRLLIDNCLVDNKNDMVDAFNNFFVNITDNLGIVDRSEVNLDYINSIDYHFNDSGGFIAYDNYIVTSLEVENIIASMPNKKSVGFDNISIALVKSISSAISHCLANIANVMFSSGIFPDSCKIARCIVLFKKGSRELMSNYRPISLLPIFSKIFEKLMHARLCKFLEDNNCIHPSQYGFRSKSNTSLALLDFTEKVRKTIDDGKVAAGIFLDIAKAFDCVNHRILLNKMVKFGIHGLNLKLFDNYLTNRKQFIDVDGHRSALLNISSGVPQGSILGPTLFLIYINDIYNIGINAKITSFADDTSLLFVDKNINNLYNTINNDLYILNNWFLNNNLSVNVSKSVLVLFTTTHNNVKINKIIDQDLLRISLNNTEIVRCQQVNYLGLIIDFNLTWKQHINFVIQKISKQVGLLGKLRHYVPKNLLLAYYYAHVQSHIFYGIEVYGLTPKSNVKPLISIINRSVQIISFANFVDHATPLRVKLGIPSFSNLLMRAIIVDMHKIIFKIGHAHVNFAITCRHTGVRTRLDDNIYNLNVSRVRTSLGRYSFNFVGCKAWNLLPSNVQCITNDNIIFKNYIKQHMNWDNYII